MLEYNKLFDKASLFGNRLVVPGRSNAWSSSSSSSSDVEVSLMMDCIPLFSFGIVVLVFDEPMWFVFFLLALLATIEEVGEEEEEEEESSKRFRGLVRLAAEVDAMLVGDARVGRDDTDGGGGGG